MRKVKILFITVLLFLNAWAYSAVNITTSPLIPLIGGVNLAADIQIAGAWTIGPEMTYLNTTSGDYDVKASAIGVKGKYFFNGAALTQGWYLSSALSHMNIKVSEDDSVYGELEGKASGWAINFLGGHMWMWESFNISLGAGIAHYNLNNITVENENDTYEEDYEESLTGTGLGIDFNLGWKF